MANIHRKNLIYTLVVSALCTNTYAQIVLDGSTGSSGNIDANTDKVYEITSNLGRINGSNLFHSFTEFSVESQHTAHFSHNGSQNISNVISRVTGNNPSEIYGTIKSSIPGADFYLLNPNGVLFGEGASLDITGSFYATTANYIDFSDGYRMDTAVNPNMSFTSAAPSEFGFTSTSPGNIEVNGTKLSLNNGESLSLIGGDTTIDDATLQVSDGLINLASAASAGEVLPSASDVKMEDFGQLGDIDLINNARIDVSGNSGGRIVIRGGSLKLNHSSIKSDIKLRGSGSNIHSDSINIATQATIHLDNKSSITDTVGFYAKANTKGISLSSNEVTIDNGSLIESNTKALSDGTSGGVLISSNTTHISNKSKVAANNSGNGTSGDIDINSKFIHISNKSFITANTKGSGSTGNIKIDSKKEVIVSAGSEIVSKTEEKSEGNGGNLYIYSEKLELSDNSFISTRSDGIGSNGNIKLDIGTLSIANASAIETISNSPAASGNIEIRSDNIFMKGLSSSEDPFGIDINAIYSTKEKPDTDGGHIDINNSGRIVLDNRSQIVSINQGSKTGNNVSIVSDTIDVLGGSQIGSYAEEAGDGDGGDVSIFTKKLNVIGINEEYFLSEGEQPKFYESTIFSYGPDEFESTGDTGDIEINTRELSVTDGAFILSRSGNSSGAPGDLRIVTDKVRISGVNSAKYQILKNVTTRPDREILVDSSSHIRKEIRFNDPNGTFPPPQSIGTFEIKADNLELDNGGFLRTASLDAADSSSLTISTKSLSLKSGSFISSQSKNRGDSGNINIFSEDISLNGEQSESIRTGIYSDAGVSGTGDSGNIAIETETLRIIHGSVITSETGGAGDGGNILIQSTQNVAINNLSEISAKASSTRGGNAGNINLSTNLLSVTNSKIITTAKAGNGGDINISAENIFITPNSVINAAAESKQFVSGTINITNNSDITSALVKLNESYTDVTAQFSNECDNTRSTASSLLVNNHFKTISTINMNPSEYSGNLATREHSQIAKVNSSPNPDKTRFVASNFENKCSR